MSVDIDDFALSLHRQPILKGCCRRRRSNEATSNRLIGRRGKSCKVIIAELGGKINTMGGGADPAYWGIIISNDPNQKGWEGVIPC